MAIDEDTASIPVAKPKLERYEIVKSVKKAVDEKDETDVIEEPLNDIIEKSKEEFIKTSHFNDKPAKPVTPTDEFDSSEKENGPRGILNAPFTEMAKKSRKSLKSEKEDYQCEFCTMDFLDSISLKRHVSERHQEDTRVLEDSDSIGVVTIENDLKNSSEKSTGFGSMLDTKKVKKMRKTPTPKKTDSIHKCDLCNIDFVSSSSLRNHIVEKHENSGERQQCDSCEKTYLRKADLKSHQNFAHIGMFYQCKECKGNFKYPQELSTHLKKKHNQYERLKLGSRLPIFLEQTPEVDHMCGLCGQYFSVINELRIHLADHNANRNPKVSNVKVENVEFGNVKVENVEFGNDKIDNTKLASVRKSKRMKKKKYYYHDESSGDSDVMVASTDEKNEIAEMVATVDERKEIIEAEPYELYFNDEVEVVNDEEEYEQIAPNEDGEPIMFWDYEKALIFGCAKCDGRFSVKEDADFHYFSAHGKAEIEI